MIRKALTHLLMTIIICCPILCSQGVCGCAKGQVADDGQVVIQQSCCCGHHGSVQSRSMGCTLVDSVEQKTDHDEPLRHACDRCQCMCGGAVVESDVAENLRLAAVSDCVVLHTVTYETVVDQVKKVCLVDFFAVGQISPSGRALRIAHMSFLC